MQVPADKLLQKLDDLVSKAKKNGADAADAVCINSISEAVEVRNQKLETIERSDSRELGLRVIIDGKQAVTSFSDDEAWNADEIVKDLIDRAKVLPKDPYGFIAPHDKITNFSLDLFDEIEVSPDMLKENALELEDIAASHKDIAQSLGASVSRSMRVFSLVNSYGFAGSYSRSGFGKSVSVLAGEGENMERDYAYDQKLFWDDMRSNKEIGEEAGQKTVRRLNPSIPKTGKMNIVFDPRIARRIIKSLASAINGGSIIKKSSFLLNKMNESILPNHLSLVDNPLLKRGLSSRPFDGEGKESQINKFINKGMLESWMLDERSAKELGLVSTSSAKRSPNALPRASHSNLALIGGDILLLELMKQNKGGIYITDVMGMGTNMLTGDYSQGASGFFIDNDGILSNPINNFTIAGNLLNMLNNLQAADDIDMNYNIATPTLAVGKLTVAGQN